MRMAPQSEAQTTSDVLEIVDDGQITTNELALRESPKVQMLAQRLDVNNRDEILAFGNDAAVQISTFADRVLHTIKSNTVTESGVMLKQLATIMKKFDMKDFEEEKPGLMGKLFGGGKSLLEKMLAKYQTVGGEIDKVFKEINTYKAEINQSNMVLDQLFQENLDYYHQLADYVAAGNLVIEELERDDLPYFEQKAQSGSQEDILNLENLKATVEMLKERIYNLEIARVVAMQTAPQIRLIQKGNYNLITKIHSAFIITIPVFKTGLVQAIALKRQKVVADSMNALDEATNQLLLKNADNLAKQGVQLAKLTGQPSVKVETLEQSWRTILSGIDETKRVEEENQRQREDGMKRLGQLQSEFHDKMKSLASR